MKKLLLFLIMLFATTSYAQTYRYDFFYGLGEKATGPALTAQCGSGTYKKEALPIGINRIIYQFEKGCGVIFNDSLTNLLSAGSYTIEMYVSLDTIDGYKKIIDFDYLTADKGFYNYSGKLNLYPNLTSNDSLIGAGVYQYLAVTRDAATKQMYVYCNNKVAGGYNDNTDQYKYGVNKKLIFFHDDNGTSAEHSGGKIAYLSISNSSTDSNTIKGRYAGLATSLGVAGISVAQDMQVYPNPVNNYLFIFAPRSDSYSIYTITGALQSQGQLETGENKISVTGMPAGIYFLKVNNGTYKIVKQ